MKEVYGQIRIKLKLVLIKRLSLHREVPFAITCDVIKQNQSEVGNIDFKIEPRKFKGGICCGGHLVVTYGAELLYLRIFSFPSSVSNQ